MGVGIGVAPNVIEPPHSDAANTLPPSLEVGIDREVAFKLMILHWTFEPIHLAESL
jgi:hypothetical protein